MRAIDLFCGLGGFSAAAVSCGLEVVWAADKSAGAVWAHAANHGGTAHEVADLCGYDFEDVPAFDVLLASPCCQGFAYARGAEADRHAAARETPWAVLACTLRHRPRAVVVENVEEMREWGADRSGDDYRAWRDAFVSAGYRVSEHVTDAVDYGVPQERKRLFVTMVREDVSSAPVALPPVPDDVRRLPASVVIDGDAGYSFSLVEDKAIATREKVEYTRARLKASRFLLSFYGRTNLGRSLDRPLGTVRAGDCWALVDGDRMRMLQPKELLVAMGFDPSYALPFGRRIDAVRAVGNAVCPPQAAAVIRATLGAIRS